MVVANARRRTYPMKSFDILVDVVSDTWLKSQFPRASSHTKERAIGVVRATETDGTLITQRNIHRGKTGLRRADKEGRGDIKCGGKVTRSRRIRSAHAHRRSDELLERVESSGENVELIDRRVICIVVDLLIVRRKVDPVRRLKGQCEQKGR
jgi:hypothetical protein